MSSVRGNKKMPAIRFAGFSGDWEEKKIGDVVQLENGFAFKSKYFKIEPTNVIVLTPGSVNIGGGFQDGKGQFYDVKKEVSARYIFKSGDIFITMTDLTPTAQALGFPAIVPNDGKTYLHNQRLGKLIGYQGDDRFLFHFLCSTKKQKEVILSSSGTTVKHTSPDKFLNRFSKFPNKKEQTKIGNYFQQLDTLIAQHQQKHEKLQNIKKALLEKCFPKQGEHIPELRFKGFSGAWEEKKITDIAKVFIGLVTTMTKYYRSEGVLLIRNSDIKNNRFVFAEEPIFLDENFAEDNASRKFEIGDVATVHTGDVGTSAVITTNEENAIGFATIISRPMKNILDSRYLSTFLNTDIHKDFAINVSTGDGRSNYNLKDFYKLDVPLPVKKEQTKIGNLFQQLDTLINQQQTQLGKLKNIKQACLEKMFV